MYTFKLVHVLSLFYTELMGSTSILCFLSLFILYHSSCFLNVRYILILHFRLYTPVWLHEWQMVKLLFSFILIIVINKASGFLF